MQDKIDFEIIIIGGSYAGLSAAMTLGRSLRKVLVIDAGRPCNRQTPHSHNFLTQDGQKPQYLSDLSRMQVEKYDTVEFYAGFAINAIRRVEGFEIETEKGDKFNTKKLIFATGLKDLLPEIEGLKACWGISVIHCPYCHGYEVRNQKTGILSNGETAFHYGKLILNWTKELTLFTNGKSTLTAEQTAKFKAHDIEIIEKEIKSIQHNDGKIENVIFKDDSMFSLKALYNGPPFIQHSDLPEKLGCEMTEQGLIKIDAFQKTSVEDIFAIGDNSNFRALSIAIAAGTTAGAKINAELIEAVF